MDRPLPRRVPRQPGQSQPPGLLSERFGWRARRSPGWMFPANRSGGQAGDAIGGVHSILTPAALTTSPPSDPLGPGVFRELIRRSLIAETMRTPKPLWLCFRTVFAVLAFSLCRLLA